MSLKHEVKSGQFEKRDSNQILIDPFHLFLLQMNPVRGNAIQRLFKTHKTIVDTFQIVQSIDIIHFFAKMLLLLSISDLSVTTPPPT